MGMDVIGRNPDSPRGEYFRATIWSWRPIHGLIIELCWDLLDEDTMQGIAFNDGAGPEDARTCMLMADRFDQWLSRHGSGHSVYVEREGSFESVVVAALEQAGWKMAEDFESNFTVSREQLETWVDFLRHCGGFQVR